MVNKRNIILFFSLFAVSTTSIIVRFIPELSAVAIAFWRMAVASILLWGVSLVKSQQSLTKTNRRLTIIAGVILGFHFACFFGAIKYTSIANATLLAALAPIYTLIIEKVFFKKDFNRLIILGLILALIGLLIIIGFSQFLGNEDLLGRGLALLSGMAIAFVFLLSGKVREKTNTISYTRSLYSSAAVCLLILGFIGSGPFLPVSISNIILLFILGLVPTIFGHSGLYYSIKYSSPTLVASIPIGEPVIASLLALLVLSEAIPLNTGLGGVLVLVGLYLTVRHHEPLI